MSLGVGFLVAKAMMLGSKGIGGRRYQITAALLTYAAVSMAAMPIALIPVIKNHSQQQRQASSSRQNPQEQTAEDQDAREKLSFAKALGILALIGLASPFLELTESLVYGLIALIILLVGIHIAWRMTAGKQLDIFGPFQNAPQKVP
jgi:predicted histidine transporter YuiF (NhaC family)